VHVVRKPIPVVDDRAKARITPDPRLCHSVPVRDQSARYPSEKRRVAGKPLPMLPVLARAGGFAE
jgi:hypothetical protein